jgi:hypothetical protein
LSEECNNPGIVAISEHHMNDNELSNLSMPRYNVATGFSHKTYNNGRVCILVKDNILYGVMDLHRLCKENIF